VKPDAIAREPWRFDFFAVLRWLERTHPQKPRIGKSATLRDEIVRLGQDPYFEFPASTLNAYEDGADGVARINARFLGLLGPQGALPLATTEESYLWFLAQDDAYPRFLDIINHRFIALFFRAWADARPIAQHDRPDADRFETYVGSAIGLGSAVFRDLDTIPDRGKLAFAGLLGPRAKSASRLAGFIRGHFGVAAEIIEFVGSRLVLDPRDRSLLGACTLGADTLVGGSVYSVLDKFRIRIYVPDMEAFRRFLPEGDRCEPLVDMVYFYVGDELDYELELAIPAKAVEPVKLGKSGALGWTTWVSPDWSEGDTYRADARFHPAERIRAKRAARPNPLR
jgi:type VI secretion system protein ImpH